MGVFLIPVTVLVGVRMGMVVRVVAPLDRS